MRKLLNQIMANFDNSKKDTIEFSCNYSNNYYGDQVCLVQHSN